MFRSRPVIEDIVLTAVISKPKLITIYKYYIENERIADIYHLMKNEVSSKYTLKDCVRRFKIGKAELEFLKKNIDTLMNLEPLVIYERGRYRVICKLCGKKMCEPSLYHHIRKKHKDYIIKIINELMNDGKE